MKIAEKFMSKFKETTIKIFLITTLLYFCMVFLLEFKTFISIMGHFNYIPPKVSVEKFMNTPIKGKIMAELELLCKNCKPNTIGMSWQDYYKTVMLSMDECRYSFMMFEKFYKKYGNPVRLKLEKMNQMDLYITCLGTSTVNSSELVIAKTMHFSLFGRVKK